MKKEENAAKTTIITRKIKVVFDETDMEVRKEYWKYFRIINLWKGKGCNKTVAVLLARQMLKDSPYFKVECTGRSGNPISAEESIAYQPLAEAAQEVREKYGIKCPTKYFNAEKPLVTSAFRNFIKEVKKKGWTRSLMSYKDNSPLHFKFSEMKNFRLEEHEKNGRKYEDLFFSIDEIPFRSMFGRDRSDNRAIVKKVISGEYKAATCGLQLPKRMGEGMTLLLVVNIPVREGELDPQKHALAFIAPDAPMRVVCGIENGKCRDRQIGSGSDYFNNRIRFQAERRSLQRDVTFCRGGHGRGRKLKACNAYGKREGNYMKKQVEKWSKDLLDMVVKEGCGTLLLFGRERFEAVNKVFSESHEYALDDFPLTLRNWSFSGLNIRIKQVAAKYGVNVVEMAEGGDEKNAFANEDKKMTKEIAKWETFLSNLYDSFGYACKNAKKWMRKKRRDEEGDNDKKPKKTVRTTETDTQLSFDF